MVLVRVQPNSRAVVCASPSPPSSSPPPPPPAVFLSPFICINDVQYVRVPFLPTTHRSPAPREGGAPPHCPPAGFPGPKRLGGGTGAKIKIRWTGGGGGGGGSKQ